MVLSMRSEESETLLWLTSTPFAGGTGLDGTYKALRGMRAGLLYGVSIPGGWVKLQGILCHRGV